MSCNQNAKQTDINHIQANLADIETTAGDGVFIHITENYNDPHRVLMP